MPYVYNKKVNELKQKLEDLGFRVARKRENEILLDRRFKRDVDDTRISVTLYSDGEDVSYKAVQYYKNDLFGDDESNANNIGRAHYQFRFVLNDDGTVSLEKSIVVCLPVRGPYDLWSPTYDDTESFTIIFSPYYEVIPEMQELISLLGPVKCKKGYPDTVMVGVTA